MGADGQGEEGSKAAQLVGTTLLFQNRGLERACSGKKCRWCKGLGVLEQKSASLRKTQMFQPRSGAKGSPRRGNWGFLEQPFVPPPAEEKERPSRRPLASAGFQFNAGRIAELSVAAAVVESSEIAGSDFYSAKVEVDLADTAIVIAPRPV